MTFFFPPFPSELIHSPNCADDLIICSCVLQALPPPQLPGITSGAEPWYLGLTHLEGTVFESGAFWNPFHSCWCSQVAGKSSANLCLGRCPSGLHIVKIYREGQGGHGYCFWYLFIFHLLRPWASADLTLEMILNPLNQFCLCSF